jgi:hypothetical protein
MSDTNDDAGIGHNIVGEKKRFYETVESLGLTEGVGSTSRTHLAKCVLGAAEKSLIKPHEAKFIFHSYAEASKRGGGTPGSTDTNVSKIKKLIEFGNQNDGYAVAEDAMRLHPDVENAKSLFEGLVQVARVYLKERRRLTDEELTVALSKVPPKEKTDRRLRDAAIKHVTALVKSKDTAALDEIRALLDQQPIENSEEIHKAEAA